MVTLGLLCNYGALAQMGERLICIQEVSGSIPLGSTNYSVRSMGGYFLLRALIAAPVSSI